MNEKLSIEVSLGDISKDVYIWINKWHVANIARIKASHINGKSFKKKLKRTYFIHKDA
jgi:hypothetical protein